MTPSDFCIFFQGALAMAKGTEGPVTFTAAQIQQIEEKLEAALAPQHSPSGRPPEHLSHLSGRPPGARC